MPKTPNPWREFAEMAKEFSDKEWPERKAFELLLEWIKSRRVTGAVEDPALQLQEEQARQRREEEFEKFSAPMP